MYHSDNTFLVCAGHATNKRATKSSHGTFVGIPLMKNLFDILDSTSYICVNLFVAIPIYIIVYLSLLLFTGHESDTADGDFIIDTSVTTMSKTSLQPSIVIPTVAGDTNPQFE